MISIITLIPFLLSLKLFSIHYICIFVIKYPWPRFPHLVSAKGEKHNNFRFFLPMNFGRTHSDHNTSCQFHLCYLLPLTQTLLSGENREVKNSNVLCTPPSSTR